jgi:2',3'-cyclic-nucleotide 2'-phosphodiesterase (5'-nucleotidase family)
MPIRSKTVAALVLVLSVFTLVLNGCTKADPSVHAAVPVVPAPETLVRLTFLVTGAENGYLLPTASQTTGGPTHGGAAEMLGRWVTLEGHCAGPLGTDGAAACDQGNTVVVSTGDNANGQAISSYFKGESTAQVMRHMGYAASALGNRELDWSREQFLKNAATGGYPYLAANLEATDPESKKLGLAPYRIITRQGVTIGLIGLSSHKATLTPMPGRMAGVTWEKEESALARVVPAVKAAGAQVIAIVSDGCLEDLAPLFEGHEPWQVAFVAGRKCDAPFAESVAATRMVYPGRHFNEYVRVAVMLDVSKPVGQQLISSTSKNVEVINDGTPAPEPQVKEIVGQWQAKLDAELGGSIGFTKTGLDQESAEMSTWLTTALKEQTKTDIALINRKGVRQSLPPGPMTKATIYDLAPFENQVVLLKLTGAQVLSALSNVQARVAGLKPKGETFIDAKGAPLDLKKTYSVATLDYLYLGGDGFTLNQADPHPTMTSSSWQSVLIAWTTAQKTDETKPLEAHIKVK